MKKATCFILLISLLTVATTPAVQGEEDIPADVRCYQRDGESIQHLPPILFNNITYDVYLFAKNALDDPYGEVLFSNDLKSLNDHRITAIVVTANDRVVTDEATIFWVLLLARTGYLLHQTYQAEFDLTIPSDTGIQEEIEALRKNPWFVAAFAMQNLNALFDTRSGETTEAIRALLVSQAATPELANSFVQDLEENIKISRDVEQVLDSLIQTEKYANNRNIREWARIARYDFKDWQTFGAYIDTPQGRLSFANGLELLGLGVRLVILEDFQDERVEWLRSYSMLFSGSSGRLDPDQALALDIVLQEAASENNQRLGVVKDFIKENLVDMAVDMGKDTLVKEWAKYSWKTWGTRTTGHLAAGVGSSVLLGFTIANLLYGMDDVYNNFTTADRADELRERFHQGRMMLVEMDWEREPSFYDGELLEAFRVAYLLEALASSQVYRSAADGVNSSRSIKGLMDQITNDAWSESIKGLREMADQIEADADALLGHPMVIDYAVDLSLLRLDILPPLDNATLDAKILQQPGFLVLHPEETQAFVFDFQNTGNVAWTQAEDYALVNANDQPLGADMIQPLESDIPPGHIARWVITATAPAEIGWYSSQWQLELAGESIGEGATAQILVLPEGELDLDPASIINAWFEGLLKKINQELESAWHRLLAELEKWLQRELVEMLSKIESEMLQSCCGVNAIAPIALLAGVGAFRKRKKGA
ncbi:MAG: hypothetical protein JXA42_23015 [Anaerolineales bacterium]|nr:hypothetical protein [Anaerolineales bacterium]